jgi:hypothetical protein
MVMGKPSWMCSKGYPADFTKWPKAEAYFNTRYVWAHSEFTPQQTMRGKTALYGYLYGLGTHRSGSVKYTYKSRQGTVAKVKKISIVNGVLHIPALENTTIRLLDLKGRTIGKASTASSSDVAVPLSTVRSNGVVIVEYECGNGNVARDKLVVQQ